MATALLALGVAGACGDDDPEPGAGRVAPEATTTTATSVSPTTTTTDTTAPPRPSSGGHHHLSGGRSGPRGSTTKCRSNAGSPVGMRRRGLQARTNGSSDASAPSRTPIPARRPTGRHGAPGVGSVPPPGRLLVGAARDRRPLRARRSAAPRPPPRSRSHLRRSGADVRHDLTVRLPPTRSRHEPPPGRRPAVPGTCVLRGIEGAPTWCYRARAASRAGRSWRRTAGQSRPPP